MCVKGSLVLVVVLDWTQCLRQGVGAPPAMLRGCTADLPQKTGWPGLRRGGIGGYNLHSPPDCGTPTTCRLYPFGVVISGCHLHLGILYLCLLAQRPVQCYT